MLPAPTGGFVVAGTFPAPAANFLASSCTFASFSAFFAASDASIG
jgi:hypothetical protein